MLPRAPSSSSWLHPSRDRSTSPWSATFEASVKAGQPAAVAVTFLGTDPAIYVNEEPKPRLKLEPLRPCS